MSNCARWFIGKEGAVRRHEDFGLKWFAAALWVARHYFFPLWRSHREDSLQTAYLAALEAEHLDNRVQAFRMISRSFAKTAKDLTGSLKGAGRENQLELVGVADADRGIPQVSVTTLARSSGPDFPDGFAQGTLLREQAPCGACGDTGAEHLDEVLGRLCHRCYSVLRQRRRRGVAEPYKNLGARRKMSAERKQCGVPHCSAHGQYRDERYGRLCIRHANMRAKRIRLGWADPYLGFEESQEKVAQLAAFMPARNRRFWASVRLGITDAEWAALWLWAEGETPMVSKEILAKARKSAFG